MNYHELDTLLHRRVTVEEQDEIGRKIKVVKQLGPVPSRKVANNTYAERRTDGIAIRLHKTDVLTFYKNDSVVLDSGGWTTVTTKARMNQYLPTDVAIYSVKGRWYVRQKDDAAPYQDGMTVWVGDSPFAPMEGLPPERVASQNKHNKQIERLIDRHAKRYMDSQKYTWSAPCGMCVRPSRKGAQIVGEILGENTQHLIEHLIEGSVPWSLMEHASYLVNPSTARLQLKTLALMDLRRYLRDQLLVGPVSKRGSLRK